MPDRPKTLAPCPEDQPRTASPSWSPKRLAAVVEARYILEMRCR